MANENISTTELRPLPIDSQMVLINQSSLAHNQQLAIDDQSVGNSTGRSGWPDDLGGLSLNGFPSAILDNAVPVYSEMTTFAHLQDPCIATTTADLSPHSSKSPSIEPNRRFNYRPVFTFQFILMAPTSAAVLINQESLTYINQDQPYEIRCKKLTTNDQHENALYRTVVSVGFHNRRHLYMRQNLMDNWLKSHKDKKPIEIDAPLSVNISQITQQNNSVGFVWDPMNMTTVVVKMGVMSTDFTENRHGGERGVPLRLSVCTYSHNGDNSKRLHATHAQIRVFKLRGADRKNRNDRERAERRIDQEQFQPAYDYTILTESFGDDESTHSSNGGEIGQKLMLIDSDGRDRSPITSKSITPPIQAGNSGTLNSQSDCEQTRFWLKQHRFEDDWKTFVNFSGMDLFRLDREELVRLCRTSAEGIRLFHTLHSKPRTTIFVRSISSNEPYHALLLHECTVAELKRRLEMTHSKWQSTTILSTGPGDIRVVLTDEQIAQWHDQSVFSIDCNENKSELLMRKCITINDGTKGM